MYASAYHVLFICSADTHRHSHRMCAHGSHTVHSVRHTIVFHPHKNHYPKKIHFFSGVLCIPTILAERHIPVDVTFLNYEAISFAALLKKNNTLADKIQVVENYMLACKICKIKSMNQLNSF